MTLQWCEDAESFITELTNDGVPSVDYVLFAMENPKAAQPKMELFSMGKGGRAKVEELLLPETHQVITGAFLASAIDERGSVVSVRRKFIHVIWVGTRVGIMVKGKVNTSLTQPFKDPFPGCAMYLQLSDGDVDDLQAAGLEKTLLASGGAHKPTRYSFTNRTLIGSLNMDDSSFNNSERRAEDEKRRAEAEARRKAAAEAARNKAAQAEKQRLAEEEAKRIAQEEAKRQADAERRKQEEERAQKVMAQDAERKSREDAARMAQEEAQRQADEARRQQEEERAQKINAQEADRKAKEDAARRKAYEEEQKAAAMTPSAALKANDKSLIMLISSMSGNMTTSTNQARARSMLEGLEVSPEVVDGAEPTNKDMRNELFSISGLRGKYPQFFLRQKDGSIKFFADMETFDDYNDTGTLAQQLGMSATPKNNAGNHSNLADPPQVVSTLNGHKLLLLISSMSGSLEVSANQARVQAILNGLHLSKEEIEIMDGCEASIRERRNELFGISGIRAKYPQLFLVNMDSGDTRFVGNFVDISYLHDTNTLNQAVGLVTKTTTSSTAATTPPAAPPSAVEETAAPVVVAETVEQPISEPPADEPKTTTDETADEPDADNKVEAEEIEEKQQPSHSEPDEGPSTAASQPEPSSQPSEQEPPHVEEPPKEEETPLPSPPVEEMDPRQSPIVEEAPANPMKTSPPEELPPQQQNQQEEAQQQVPATEAPNEPSANEEISQECEPDDTPPKTEPEKTASDEVNVGDGGDTVEETPPPKPEETADEAAASQVPEKEKVAEPVDPSGEDNAENEAGEAGIDASSSPTQEAAETSQVVDQSAEQEEDGPPDIVATESSVVDEAELPSLVGSDSQLDGPDKDEVESDTPAEEDAPPTEAEENAGT